MLTFRVHHSLTGHRVRSLLKLEVHEGVSSLADLAQVEVSRRCQKSGRGAGKRRRHRRRRVDGGDRFSAQVSCQDRVGHGRVLFAEAGETLLPVSSVADVRNVGPLFDRDFRLKSGPTLRSKFSKLRRSFPRSLYKMLLSH